MAFCTYKYVSYCYDYVCQSVIPETKFSGNAIVYCYIFRDTEFGFLEQQNYVIYHFVMFCTIKNKHYLLWVKQLL